MEKIALLPGGFKPPHAGHYNMAKWLAVNTDANTVIVKVGAKERDGITRDMSLKLWDLYRSTDSDPASNKLTIIPSKHNSPVKDVYDFIENDAPEGSTIYLAMGEKEIKTNDQRFANIYKFSEPRNINFETKLVPPQAGGVSGTDMRDFIKSKDQYSFFEFIPDHLTSEQKEQAWQIVTTKEVSDWKPGDPVSFEMWTSDWNLKGFGKEYDSNFKNREAAVAYYKPNKAEDWAFKSYAYVAKKISGFGGGLEEDLYNPEDKVLDYMRGSEWKAGMPDGPKDDIPRALKYKRGGKYNAATGQGGGGTMYENLSKELPIEIMNTPELQIQGMMGRDSLEGGMLFPYEEVGERSFHMKNCLIPLDIVFTAHDEITNIHPNCPPCLEDNCPQYTGIADNVLELPGGYCQQNNINIGDYIPRHGDRIHNRQTSPISWEESINESRGGKSELHIYDFDETIARVETPIPYTVESPEGKTIEKGETTSVEFEETKDHLKDLYGEENKINWDFKAFANLINKGTLNNEVFQKLLKSIQNPNAKVTILTARAVGLPVTKFLKDQGIWAYVVPLGSTKEKGQSVTGEDKANWIEKRLKDITKKVIFIDDAPENRKAIYTLRDKYPSIEFDIENPLEIEEMMGTMNNQEKAKHAKNLKRLNKDLKKQGDQYMEVPNYLKGTLTRKLYEQEKPHTISTALINNNIIPLETMNTPDEQMTGMMGRDSLKGGMLFPYNNVQRRDFHMKGCKIPLDIIFIKQGKINNIHHNCPPCKQNNCPNYSGTADNVLEFPSGYCKKNNVNIGDQIGLNILQQDNKMKYNLKEIKYGINEYGADTSWEGEDGDKITLEDILELTKDIKITPYPTEILANVVLNWDNNPEEIKRISQVEVSEDYPILIMVDEQGKIQWILDGNHRAKQTLDAKAKTIPAKLIKPSNLSPQAKKIFSLNEEKPGLWANIRAKRKSGKPMAKKGYMKEENVFTKEWWKDIINEILLTEGGAPGHMAHPFDLDNVNSGKDLIEIIEKAFESLSITPGSVKIDGTNTSVRLIDVDGEKQFAMDRGSKKDIDVKGITKDDLTTRFKTKDGSPHGMVAAGSKVLDLFNGALSYIEDDLKKIGSWDNSDILFNTEYVAGKTNVQQYDESFLAIHDVKEMKMIEEPSKATGKPLIKRKAINVDVNSNVFQSLIDNFNKYAQTQGFKIYGQVATEVIKKPAFNSALSKNYKIKTNEGDINKSLKTLLDELDVIPKEDFIFMNGVPKEVGAVSKRVYTTILDGGNIDELFESEEDKSLAVKGFTTYLATEMLGQEVLKVLDSPMGTVDKHEGVVIRDEKIANKIFKLSGEFIRRGMTSDF